MDRNTKREIDYRRNNTFANKIRVYFTKERPDLAYTAYMIYMLQYKGIIEDGPLEMIPLLTRDTKINEEYPTIYEEL